MRISKQEIKQIIDEQLLLLVEQEIEELQPEQVGTAPIIDRRDTENANKQLLIAAVYYKKILSSVMQVRDRKRKISNIIKSDHFSKVNNILANIIGVLPPPQEINSNIEYIVSLLQKREYTPSEVIQRSAIAIQKISGFLTSYLEIPDNLEVEQDPSQRTELYLKFDTFLKYLNIIIERLNANIALSPEIGKTFNKGDYASNIRKMPNLEHLQAFSDFEKLTTQYFKAIGLCLNKVASIGIDIAESTKTNIDYPLTKPKAQLAQAIEREETLFNNPSSKRPYKSNLRPLQRDILHPSANETRMFDKKMFVDALYNPSKYGAEIRTGAKLEPEKQAEVSNRIQYKSEIDKAENINISINQIDNLDKKISEIDIDKISTLLDSDQKKYIDYTEENTYKTYPHKIMLYVNSVKKQYKLLMKEFLNMLDRKDEDIAHYFNTSSDKFSTLIKFTEFCIMNNKQLFLSIVHHKESQTGPNLRDIASQYSDEKQAKIKERLRYWNLFYKLGWTSQEAPTWLYE